MVKKAAVGAELRALRLACGLTMVEAARRAGTSRVTLHRWETGENVPPSEALDRLLQGLGAGSDDRARLLTTVAPRAAHSQLTGTRLGAPVHPGHALRALRVRRGLTQGALAQAAGVGQSLVAMWESGSRAPTGEALTRALAALGATAEEAAWLAPGAHDGYTPLRDPDEARARIRRLIPVPARADPVPLIALERELWELAARDRRWEPPLIEAMGWRAMSHLYLGEFEAALEVVRRGFRLVRSNEAWDSALQIFGVMCGLRQRRGVESARLVPIFEELESKLRDPDVLLWCISEQWCFGEDPGELKRHAQRLMDLATVEGEGAEGVDNVTVTRKDARCVLAWHCAEEGDVAGTVDHLRRIAAVREDGILSHRRTTFIYADALRFAGESAPNALIEAVDAHRRHPDRRHLEEDRELLAWTGLVPLPTPSPRRTAESTPSLLAPPSP